MNYRHIYHAGNFADVVKHALLIVLLQFMQKKAAPFCYIDTHAGQGVYALNSAEAQKTQEYLAGVARFLQASQVHAAPLKFFRELLQNPAFFSNDCMIQYPGSPFLAQRLLRVQDVMILNERHPEVYVQLKAHCADQAIHQRDAYEFLPAVVPPTAKRGLVLIDPPFEKKTEISDMIAALEKSLNRWPQGVYFIWLPITGVHYRDYLTQLHQLPVEESLQIEFWVDELSNEERGLLGCAFYLINPPWQFKETVEPLLQELWNILREPGKGQLVIRD